MPFFLVRAISGPVWGPTPRVRLGRRTTGVQGGSGALVAPHRPTVRAEQEPPDPPPHVGPEPGCHSQSAKCHPRPVLLPTPVHLLLFLSLTQQESHRHPRTSTPRTEPVGGKRPEKRNGQPWPTSAAARAPHSGAADHSTTAGSCSARTRTITAFMNPRISEGCKTTEKKHS